MALAETPRTLLLRLNAASKVSYKQCDEDPAGAAHEFCMSATAALDEQNISGDVLQDEKKCEAFIDRLISKVELEHLRRMVRSERTVWSNEQKGSMRYFKEQLKTMAVEAHL